MPPNKKKKKNTTTNTRPIATTSIASKSKPDLEADAVLENGLTATTIAQCNGAISDKPDPLASITKIGQEPELNQLSPEELEQQLEQNDLQSFLDNNAARVQKDFQRQKTRIHTDNRTLRIQAQPLDTDHWLPQTLLDELVQLRKKYPPYKRPSSYLESNDTEWLVRFWTLYKILSEIGISRSRIFTLLYELPLLELEAKSNYIWGLEEALDILSLDDECQLPSYYQKATIATTKIDTDQFKASPKQNGKPTSEGSATGVSTPQTLSLESDVEVSDFESDVEPDQLVDIYIKSKAKLFEIDPALVETRSQNTKKRNQAQNNPTLPLITSLGIKKLQEKIRKIEADTLFDSRAANESWTAKRIQICRDKAIATGKQSNSPTNSEPTDKLKMKEMTLDTDENTELVMGLDSMFNQDTQSSTPPATSDGISLYDFGKIGTGITARRVLEDYCKSRDSQSKLTFQMIATDKSKCRHSLMISWSKAQDLIDTDLPTPTISIDQELSSLNSNLMARVTLTMTTIATPDAKQSESYISTVALFCLIISSAKDDKSYQRLTQTWRDVWDELQKAYNEKRNAVERDLIKELRQILRNRLHDDDDDEDDVLLTATGRLALKTSQESSKSSTSFNYLNDPETMANIIMTDQHIWLSRIATYPYQYMLQIRNTLPIAQFRLAALQIINDHPITILCGETGCGKSTQLPSFILEGKLSLGEYCKVLCTEPRRISAISLAQRVSEELGEGQGNVGSASSLVGFAVRLESKVTPQSRLIYATVGVVLRMLESENGLDEYTHLVIDEVHERSIETDFLLIILKDLLQKRPYLRVILMSATVDAKKFSTYLGNAPVITVPGRTFDVQAYYLEDAIEKTGYSIRKSDQPTTDLYEDDELQGTSGLGGELDDNYSALTKRTLASYDEYAIDYQLILQIIDLVLNDVEFLPFSKAILVFLPGIGEIRELNNLISAHYPADDIVICPLHSTISSEEQQRAFIVPPAGVKKIVLSTNIAETGVTIPDITCVIDTGKHKEMRFDERRQMSRLAPSFISKANAQQRKGRAGRVQVGICFHLFTKKRYEELMAPQQTPEMLRLSLQDLIMRVKICKLGDIESTLAKAMDPPSSKNVRRAIDSLIEVGALTLKEELTPLGHKLSKLPLDANLGKLCILGAIFGCLDATLTIAAILSSKSLFVVPFGSRDQADAARLAFSRGDSDLLTVYNAYCSWRRISETPNQGIFNFCRKNFLSPQVLSNIEELKVQLFNSLCGNKICERSDGKFTSGKGEHGQHKKFLRMVGTVNSNDSVDVITNSVISWSFYPKILVLEGKGWRNITNSQVLSLHPTSVNKGSTKARYLSFYSIMQSKGRNASITNAQSTSIAHEIPLLLLAGDVDYKSHAGVISLDINRLRFAAKDWKTMIAFKMLRTNLEDLVKHSIKYPSAKTPLELQAYKKIFEKACKAVDKDNK